MTKGAGRIYSNKQHGYGYIPDLADFRDKYQKFAVTRLPDHIDLRDKMPAVYDQGQLGSCTGNAIAGAVQFERIKQQITGADTAVPSRLFIYYNERVVEGTVEEDSGAMIRDGIKSVNKLGTCFEDEWPYDINRFTTKPTDQCYTDALNNQVLKYERVYQTLHSMKACLAKGLPFVIGFTCYESFESDQVASTGQLNMPGDSEHIVGGHAVLTVGYDVASKRFLVRNSWGKDWGMDGYFSVPFDYWTNNDLASDIWAIQCCE